MPHSHNGAYHKHYISMQAIMFLQLFSIVYRIFIEDLQKFRTFASKNGHEMTDDRWHCLMAAENLGILSALLLVTKYSE